MSRLVTAGFEILVPSGVAGEAASDPEGTLAASSPNPTRDTTVFRSGQASAKMAPVAQPGSQIAFGYTAPALGQTVFVRDYIRVDAFPSLIAGDAQPRVVLFTGNTISVRLGTDATFKLWNETALAQIGASSVVLVAGQWYRVEVSLTIGTGAVDAAELRVDGVSVASTSGISITDTVPAQVNVACQCRSSEAPNTCTATVYHDDVAVNDSNGANQNSWPGEGKIVLLKPVSDNARAGFTGGAGGTTNLFDAVDNTPPVGVADTGTNTSQIRDPTSSATDNYDANVTDYTTAGLGPLDEVRVVQWLINHGTASATSPPSRAGRLVSNPAEGADTTLTTPTAAVGTYPSNWIWSKGSPIYAPTVTLGTKPVLRVGKRTASTRVVDADFMGIYVEYIPHSRPEGIVRSARDVAHQPGPFPFTPPV